VIAQKLPHSSRRRPLGYLERGAAAVEMALVLPLLLLVLFALIDFGRAFSAQIQLSQAAREGVRLASLNSGATPAAQQSDVNFGDSAIAARVQNAAGGLSGVSATTTYCPVPAGPSDSARVVVSVSFTWATGISAFSKLFGPGAFPTPNTLQATGVMRCAG
jgi:Flp pilus assembly protein TadG